MCCACAECSIERPVFKATADVMTSAANASITGAANAAPVAKPIKAAAVVAPAILNPFFTIEFFAFLKSKLKRPKYPHLL